MIEIDVESVKPVVSKTVTDTAEKMESIHSSFWSTRIDVCKALLTITCAVLVGTISFSGSLIGPGKQEIVCSPILITSWCFFVFSIISAVLSLWCSYHLNSYKVLFFNSKGVIGERLRAIGPQENKKKLTGALDGAVLDLTSLTIDSLKNYDIWSHYSTGAQLVMFILGVVSFLIFGVVQVS